ncbi:hypothetical protein CDIK_2833 [Cucumispora dikerogammari]|nr:hypothetical protein CDIK_2833 [Cucumispora dikerogammari]
MQQNIYFRISKIFHFMFIKSVRNNIDVVKVTNLENQPCIIQIKEPEISSISQTKTDWNKKTPAIGFSCLLPQGYTIEQYKINGKLEIASFNTQFWSYNNENIHDNNTVLVKKCIPFVREHINKENSVVFLLFAPDTEENHPVIEYLKMNPDNCVRFIVKLKSRNTNISPDLLIETDRIKLLIEANNELKLISADKKKQAKNNVPIKEDRFSDEKNTEALTQESDAVVKENRPPQLITKEAINPVKPLEKPHIIDAPNISLKSSKSDWSNIKYMVLSVFMFFLGLGMVVYVTVRIMRRHQRQMSIKFKKIN